MSIDPARGLSQEEVRARKEAGLCNTAQEKISKTTGQILKENICTLFNLFNVLNRHRARVRRRVDEYGVHPDHRLKYADRHHPGAACEKSSSRSSPCSPPRAPPSCATGKSKSSPSRNSCATDVVVLDAGSQICADAVLLDGEIEANESLLTGESDPVNKARGRPRAVRFLSSSAANARVQVEHVGEENYATKTSPTRSKN